MLHPMSLGLLAAMDDYDELAPCSECGETADDCTCPDGPTFELEATVPTATDVGLEPELCLAEHPALGRPCSKPRGHTGPHFDGGKGWEDP